MRPAVPDRVRHAARTSQNIGLPTLLSPKELLAFKKGISAILLSLIVLGGVMMVPRSADAGLLLSLFKFLTGAPSEIEDSIPAIISETHAEVGASVLGATSGLAQDPTQFRYENTMTVVQEHALLAPLNPLGTMTDADRGSSGQIFFYTVRQGDTLSSIARAFDVSVNTIKWANEIANANSVVPGARLIILPVSGIRHDVKKGDTLSSIAKLYRASLEDIMIFNGLAPDEHLLPGLVVIVPDGELTESAPITSGITSINSFSNLPLYSGYYMRPIIGGRRSRGVHGFNGIDLANSCGLPVLASANGSAIITKSSGWNGGYGKYIVLTHANGTQTLYAHLSSVNVTPGELVRQGDTIGLIGSTGNSTGCHIHFEVRGAKNPF